MERSLTGTTDSEFDNGWVRLTLTFTVAENNTKAEVFAGIANTTGTVWIDSIQLETGEVANKLNLIKNSGFQSTTNGKLDHWSFSETPVSSGVGSPPSYTQAALINPTISGRPKFSQAINVQGKEGTSIPSAAGPALRERSRGRIPHCRGVYLRWSPSAMVYCAV